MPYVARGQRVAPVSLAVLSGLPLLLRKNFTQDEPMKILETQEPVYAMASVGDCYTGKRGKFLFSMSVHHGYTDRNGCYFKIYDGPAPNSGRATKLARISFLSPKYELHTDSLPAWELNAKEKRALNDFFDSSSEESVEPMSTWDYAKYQWNREMGFFFSENPSNRSAKSRQMAYLSGEFDSIENLQNHQYLRSDLTRPDYTKLP